MFGKTSVEFLGHHVDRHGIRPLQEKVKAIRATSRPTTVKELRRFLGMVNYYRRFVPKAAHHLFHLFEALKDDPKRLQWSDLRESSFEAIKDALADATMLHHPDPRLPLAVTSDASQVAIGAVIEQRGPKGWEPLAFFSKKLTPSQQKWCPYDRELHAAHKAIRHFRHMVEGRTFTLYTDHQSLIPSLRKKTDAPTARQTNQLSEIAEYTTDIRYLEGKSNYVADALSRPNGEESPSSQDSAQRVPPLGPRPITGSSEPGNVESTAPPLGPDANTGSSEPGATVLPPAISCIDKPIPEEKLSDLRHVINAIDGFDINLEAMAHLQPLDPDFQRIAAEAKTGLSFRKVQLRSAPLFVDISNGPARPFVPQSMRRQVFDVLHGLGHPGIDRTRQTIAAKFVWPSLRADVTRWARNCVKCQNSKIQRNTIPPIGDFKVPAKRFAHLHVDIVTMPPSNDFDHLLTIVDRFTRWPTAITIKGTTTETILDAFSHGWIATYGIPQAVTTDRGPQFMSQAWTQLLDTWGITHQPTTAYHPEANGMVERLHRRLKESLIALCQSERQNWYWKLPMTLLALRTTVKPDLGASPAELVFGEGVPIPGRILGGANMNESETLRQQQRTLANLRLEVERLQPVETSAHRKPRTHIPGELSTCTHVFIRRGGVQPSFTTPYEGPFRVISRSPQHFTVYLPGRGKETIALSRLKPAHLSPDDTNDSQERNFDEMVPQSPAPPGGRPRPRTRIPEPSSHTSGQDQPSHSRRLDPDVFDDETGGNNQSAFDDAPLDQRTEHLRVVPGPAPPGEPPSVSNDNVETALPPPTQHIPMLRPQPPGFPLPAANPPQQAPNAARRRPGAGGHGGTWRPRPNISFLHQDQPRSLSHSIPDVPSSLDDPDRHPKDLRNTSTRQTPAQTSRTLFLNPKPKNFSHRQSPDINALHGILRRHLNDDVSSFFS